MHGPTDLTPNPTNKMNANNDEQNLKNQNQKSRINPESNPIPSEKSKNPENPAFLQQKVNYNYQI